MDMTRWDPFRELEEMSTRLSRMFGHPLATARGTGPQQEESLVTTDWMPSVDVIEQEKEFVIKAELPEVKKEDVKISLADGVLTIQGERKQEKEENGKRYHRIERSYGSFQRSFTVPDEIDATRVNAEFKDGVLNIRLPRTEKAKPKAQEVKIS